MKKFIRDVKKFWPYIVYQSKAEIKSEISDSRLGMIWLFLEPFAFMLIYTFIGEVVFDKSTLYFPIFIFAGLMFWNFFNVVLKTSTKLVKINKEIVKKIYIPKYIFLIISCLVNLYKLFITFALLFILMIFYQVPITINILWTIPLIFNLVLFTFGISLFFMHYGVIVTDLVNITNILLRFMFYFTGIFYSIIELLPSPYNKILYTLNPLAYLITDFRNCFIYSTGINIHVFIGWFAVSLMLIFFGVKLILKHENSYVKVMR